MRDIYNYSSYTVTECNINKVISIFISKEGKQEGN